MGLKRFLNMEVLDTYNPCYRFALDNKHSKVAAM